MESEVLDMERNFTLPCVRGEGRKGEVGGEASRDAAASRIAAPARELGRARGGGGGGAPTLAMRAITSFRLPLTALSFCSQPCS